MWGERKTVSTTQVIILWSGEDIIYQKSQWEVGPGDLLNRGGESVDCNTQN